jgi:hypothetical protein
MRATPVAALPCEPKQAVAMLQARVQLVLPVCPTAESPQRAQVSRLAVARLGEPVQVPALQQQRRLPGRWRSSKRALRVSQQPPP